MTSPDAAARHTGAGVARRQAHHERMRDERAREAAAGDAELPPEDDAVEMASAVHVLDSVVLRNIRQAKREDGTEDGRHPTLG